MSNYILAYHGGKKPESPEEGAKHMAKWQAWVGGLGDAVVNPGTPLGTSKIVSSDGVSDEAGSDALTGYSIVKADSMDAALDMAKACPFLDIGTLEVAEVMEMK
ncbi:MAG: YciI family protein [Acidiferrobacterales bacterium]